MNHNLDFLKDFYDDISNMEQVKFLKTCRLQAHTFYKNLKCSEDLKKRLMDYYFLMEKGRLTNNISIRFFKV